MEPVHVRTTYHTDPNDEAGPAMFRLEVWPVPQAEGKEMFAVIEEVAKLYLIKAGWTGGETNWTVNEGPPN